MFVLILQVSGKDFPVLCIDPFHRCKPFTLAVWVITTAGTLYHAKRLGDQLVWREMMFLHVYFTVSVMLGKVSATYHASVVAANAAADKIEAVSAIETSTARSKVISRSVATHKNNIAFG